MRNRHLSESERRSIRKMKNTVYFGPTVQKLDDVCNSLSSLMTQRAQTYKALRQKQRHMEHLSATRPAGGKLLMIWSFLAIEYFFQLVALTLYVSGVRRQAHSSNSRGMSRKRMTLLRKVLMMQRKRHIVSEDNEKKVLTKTLERQVTYCRFARIDHSATLTK